MATTGAGSCRRRPGSLSNMKIDALKDARTIAYGRANRTLAPHPLSEGSLPVDAQGYMNNIIETVEPALAD